MENKEIEILEKIIEEICDYAIKNNIKPNELLDTVATNIFKLLGFCNFDTWGT